MCDCCGFFSYFTFKNNNEGTVEVECIVNEHEILTEPIQETESKRPQIFETYVLPNEVVEEDNNVESEPLTIFQASNKFDMNLQNTDKLHAFSEVRAWRGCTKAERDYRLKYLNTTIARTPRIELSENYWTGHRVSNLKMATVVKHQHIVDNIPDMIQIVKDGIRARDSGYLWKSGKDRRSNGEIWRAPNNSVIRLTITNIVSLTTQMEINKLSENDCREAFDISNDVPQLSGFYDSVFLLERTRIDYSKPDKIAYANVYIKFKQIGPNVLYVIDLHVADTLVMPAMMMNMILQKIANDTGNKFQNFSNIWDTAREKVKSKLSQRIHPSYDNM